jgi:hypothetical protein
MTPFIRLRTRGVARGAPGSSLRSIPAVFAKRTRIKRMLIGASFPSSRALLMKTFFGSSFFRLFDLLLSETNPGQKMDDWTIGDVRVVRERHSFSGSSHCYAIDVFTVSRPGRHRWTLMVVKEYWWDGGHQHTIKTFSWSKQIDGNRREIMKWLRSQENTRSGLAASRR